MILARNSYLEPEQTCHGTGYVPRAPYLCIGIAHSVCVCVCVCVCVFISASWEMISPVGNTCVVHKRLTLLINEVSTDALKFGTQ